MICAIRHRGQYAVHSPPSSRRFRPSAPRHSGDSRNPAPFPTGSRARHAARRRSPETSPRARSSRRSRGSHLCCSRRARCRAPPARPSRSRTVCRWRGSDRSGRPTSNASSSLPAPRTPTPPRSAADSSLPSHSTASPDNPALHPMSGRGPDGPPSRSPICFPPVPSDPKYILLPDGTPPTRRASPRTLPPRRAGQSSPHAAAIHRPRDPLPPMVSPSGTTRPEPPPSRGSPCSRPET